MHGKKTIFRSIFIPLILIMVLQASLFYLAAVYGGIEESLSRNAADILSERLINRKTELETQLHNRSLDLDDLILTLDRQYAAYAREHGDKPLTQAQLQIQFLGDCADELVETLRHTETTGVFLILNDRTDAAFAGPGSEKKYGLCIRDMDPESNYAGREDLLLERSPSSIVESLGCALDSWWEAWYTFEDKAHGDYYYAPLDAAWAHPGARGLDLAYLSGVHQLSGSDQPVISYSVPLIAEDGYPYGVVGIELTTKYLASLLPYASQSDQTEPCYVLALQEAGSDVCVPIVGVGALYNRCFGSGSVISVANTAAIGGFTVTGRGDVELYGNQVELRVYNNNNPFENRRLTLLALAESDVLFAYIERVKLTLLVVSLFCLALGVASIFLVSRRFASPITALARRVRDMTPEAAFELERLGIAEIDQLVVAIEELNRNVSRSSARTEFFSRMSHDMRTPMNAIIGFSSPELLSGASAPVKDDYLQKIHASGNYLLGLINEVLDMTKIESNKTELRLSPMPADCLFDTALPIIGNLAQEKGLSFTSDISIPPDVYVSADAQHISQIVMNLLSNAVKFTPAGGAVQLTADMTDDPRDPSATRCRIVVRDSGIGMSEDFMQNLYLPFEQASSAHEGTGLGLTITKRLLELMGGTIACTSKLGEGTTFTVELPLIKSTAEAALSQAQGQTAGQANRRALRGKRILLCEDNELNAQIATHLLNKAGAVVEVAENGQRGVDMFAASAIDGFDAVLMDIRMPVMDGMAATGCIRALPRPDAARIPIIAMTADAFTEDVQASKAAGMNDHLTKPIETERFFAVLAQHLRGTDA